MPTHQRCNEPEVEATPIEMDAASSVQPSAELSMQSKIADASQATLKRPAADAIASTVEEDETTAKKPKLTEQTEDVEEKEEEDVVMESEDDDRTESEGEGETTKRRRASTIEKPTVNMTISTVRATFHETLKKGDEVDVYCVRSKAWLPAKLEAVDDDRQCRVHFMGWNKKSDENILAASLYRIAPRGEETPEAWEAIDATQEKVQLSKAKKFQDALTQFHLRAAAKAEAKAKATDSTILIPSDDVATGSETSAFVNAGATRSGRRITKRIHTDTTAVLPSRKQPSVKSLPLKKSKEEQAREIQEDNLCGICGEYEADSMTDMVLCDGGCLNSYHFSCIGIDAVPDEETWLCEQCRTNEQQCFQCGRNGTINEKGGVFRCSVASCGKFYHQHCVDSGKHFRRLGRAKLVARETSHNYGEDKETEVHEVESSFRCPRHVCAVCENTKKADLMQCLRCPEAYHPHCVAPSARYNNLGLLCYRHPTENLPRIPAQYLTDRTFDSVVVDFNLRLPVLFIPKHEPKASDPTDCHHFRLQLDLMDEVKKEPPAYRKLVRNIYTFKQLKESMEDVPECVCTKACGDDCINRLSFTECFGPAPTDGLVPLKASERREKEANCRLGEECGNRALHQRTYPRFDRFHTVEKGWGLKVLEAVKPGQLVIEYVGEVINEDEKDRRLSEHARLHPDDKNMYIMELSKGVYIDARHKGSVSRFINHSCDPNCRLLKWNVRGVNRIAITAVKEIAAGEELSYDYQFHTSQALEWRCYCKATNCRGTMAPEKLNLGGDQGNPLKKLTKKELAKKMKRAMVQEKVNVRKDEKETAKRLSLTAPVARTIGRTGPVPRELKWAKATHVFLARNAKQGFDYLQRLHLLDHRLKAAAANRPVDASVKAEDSASTVSTEEESVESSGVRLKVVSRPPKSMLQPESNDIEEQPIRLDAITTKEMAH